MKEKKKFKMPHLMAMIVGLILIMSLLTYIVPAGQFAADPVTGKIDGNAFSFLGYQTPVNPWQALLYIAQGIANSGSIIATLLATGGLTGIILATKRMDNVIDWAIYRLSGKGIDVLVPLLTLVFCVYGTFSGGDWCVAMVPIGCMIAKKLNCDPMLGGAFVLIGCMVGGIFSPTAPMLVQLTMDVPVYSGFAMRMLLDIPVYAMTMFWMWRYAKKVAKDPTKSAMGNTDWMNTDYSGVGVKEVSLDKRDVICTALYFAQPVTSVICTTMLGYSVEVIPALCIIYGFLIGVVHGYKLDDTCNKFANGVAGMAFVGFIIGCANCMSLVMTNGNIIHTIVYFACLPLRNVGAGFAAVGIAIIITLINIIIPSASAKIAILCPIISPMCDALSIHRQIGVTAFKVGDAVTNMISPTLGMLVGGLEVAGVPYDKWLKWIMPFILIVLAYGYVALYVLGAVGWTGL